jgi:hypothetical protein
MTTIAIEFNDAALLAAGPDGVLGSGNGFEPGYATISGGTPLFGTAARRQARLRPRETHDHFWHELSSQPMAGLTGSMVTSADLVHAHLQSLWHGWSAGVSGVIFVVPAYWSQEQLGLLLGLGEELTIPVIGLVDSAVAATRCRYAADDLLHIEASLHAITVTRMKQGSGAAIESRQLLDGIGIERLEQACVKHIAARFLERTRFDPLHDAASEQSLYDGLGDWLRALQRSSSVTATLDLGDDEYAVLIERDGLVQALASCCEPLMQHLRSCLMAGHRAAIQITDRLAWFPGVVDAIERLPQVVTFVLEPAAAAHGALSRVGQFAKGNGGVPFKTALRWDRPAVEIEVSDQSPQQTSVSVPTHILYAERLYRISRQPVCIGSELTVGEYGIDLSAGNRGVSRRHCSIQIGANGAELTDHSRFGTRLNGHTINKAVILQAGDIISVGEPPVDFQIVTEVASQDLSDGT